MSKRYVGVPGMNSICRALCHEPGMYKFYYFSFWNNSYLRLNVIALHCISLGVESKFGTSVGRLEWLEGEDLWSVMGLDGQNLGRFNGVVASDKNIASPRFTSVTGRLPPLGMIFLLLQYILLKYAQIICL